MSENIYKEEKSINYVYMQLRDTGEFYIGIHSDNEPDDDYNGSGSVFKVKYEFDPSRFNKTILFYGDTRNKILMMEALLVTEESIKNPLCLNLIPGGGITPDRSKAVIDPNGIEHKSRTDAAKVWGCSEYTIRYRVKNELGWSNVEGDNISDEDKNKRKDEQKEAELKRNEALSKRNKGTKGAKHPRADLRIHHFIHKKSGETFTGTRIQLQEAYPELNWDSSSLSKMINPNGRLKSHCGWRVVL